MNTENLYLNEEQITALLDNTPAEIVCYQIRPLRETELDVHEPDSLITGYAVGLTIGDITFVDYEAQEEFWAKELAKAAEREYPGVSVNNCGGLANVSITLFPNDERE